MASGLFGWDLLYKTVEDDIRSNQDILVCLTHFVLISNGFKCIGLGESKVIDGTENKTEVLPKGWNDEFTIRYVYQGRLYNLKGTNLDDAIMINLIRVDERTVSLVQLNLRSVIQKTGTLQEMIPDNENIVDLIKKQLIDKVVVSKKSKEGSTQTNPLPGARPSSQGVLPQNPQQPQRFEPPQIIPNLFNPRNYGRDDLDPLGGMDPLRGPPNPFLPLGGGGGGMLFDPQQPFGARPPAGIPPGSLPPGARFDPFRAPDERFPPRRPPNRPDNDEMPPPGYDDMFM